MSDEELAKVTPQTARLSATMNWLGVSADARRPLQPTYASRPRGDIGPGDVLLILYEPGQLRLVTR